MVEILEFQYKSLKESWIFSYNLLKTFCCVKLEK